MIALLTGRLESLESDRCVLDVNGVGYLLHASTRTLAALPHPPAVARVLVETQVREDAISLYGFADSAERDWFRLLTTVQGVGAKVALNILSALGPGELAAAIASGDQRSLTRASGVGARLAARVLSELRNKAGTIPTSPGGIVGSGPQGGIEGDALSAMLNLGYRRAEAQAAIRRAIARLGEGAELDAVIRDSLRELAPS